MNEPPSAGSETPASASPVTPPRGLIGLAVLFVVGCVVLLTLRPQGPPAGNRLVVLNAGTSSLDSIVIEPEPPGANLLAARAGYVAAQDSVWIALPKAAGDTDIRIYRGGAAVANHAVYFGGNTIFELRVGDRDQQGIYRRLAR